VIAADARYRGCENQLYRVEIHQGGVAGTAAAPGTASFKWSRENGSVVFPVAGSIAATTLADGSTQIAVPLARLGRDARLGLAVNDWVELVDDRYTLGQRAYPLLQVAAIDVAGCSVTLAAPKGVAWWPLSSDPLQHPLLRRWDQQEGASAQGVAVTEGASASITLEDGIQVTFAPGGLYATGDYWLIPARVAGDDQLDWPTDASGAAAVLPPRGRHHYAVLGVNGANGYQECCCRFGTLCDLFQANAKRLAAAASPAAAPPPAKATGAATSRVAAAKPAATKAKGKRATTKKSP
jgi:hypothetical protein